MLVERLEQIQLGVLFDLHTQVVQLLDRCVTSQEVKRSGTGPAFQTQFGFVPCYVNSRLTGRGIPVSCEVDIYGALSEFIGTAVSDDKDLVATGSTSPSAT